ncbi:ABC transporter ATP-binding protein [Bauldia sp.]|uniref:ABC transporter ATP-binding protein n=1 Tax=Bauldia sp. TaxID=2575872 RepID=UPI003BAB6378
MGEIVLQDVHKAFGDVTVVRDINLRIADGEFVVFVGPSGCGKSTLLRMITGLETVTNGRVLIDDEDVTEAKPSSRGLAMVFQSYALFPHLTVRDNIGFGLRIAGLPRSEIAAKVAQASSILGLDKLLDRKPRELSGGQQQRVAIGRAIVREPSAFLFDEPLSNLDAALRVQMRIELIRLHRRLNTTMVFVTHDQVEAMTMADRIVVLEGGHIQQFATPIELYDRPVNQFVAGFIGSPKMNFLEAKPTGDGRVQVNNGPALAPHDAKTDRLAMAQTVGIRPEHITYSHDSGDLTGTIVVEEQLGSDAFLYVDVEGIGMVTVRAVGERDFHSDQTVHLTLPPDRCHVFDREGLRINTN